VSSTLLSRPLRLLVAEDSEDDFEILLRELRRGGYEVTAMRVPLQPDGGVSKVGRFVSLYGVSGPDGLALTEDDSLCVAHASLGAVFVFAASGEPRWRIASCAGKTTTNVAFGGTAWRTLYITESATGSILCADLPVAGKRLPLV